MFGFSILELQQKKEGEEREGCEVGSRGERKRRGWWVDESDDNEGDRYRNGKKKLGFII